MILRGNSNTGYAVLGLDFAESAVYGFEATIPATIKTGLNNWINFIQTPVTETPNDGGSGYTAPNSWVNILRTGNLIYQMAFVGDTATTPRVIDAVDYIERHWDDANWDPGWKGPAGRNPHYQTAYCLMKGLDRMGIDTITVDGSPVDWFDEISTIIVDSQNADGSWPHDYWGDSMLATEWALLTLERVVPPFEVDIDIKPGSFPNSINPNGKGVIPVAILTTPDFDATTVDASTVTFGPGAATMVHKNAHLEDVDGDGDIDMVLHFKTQDTGISAGDTEATLAGETVGGQVFEGTDSVRTVGKP